METNKETLKQNLYEKVPPQYLDLVKKACNLMEEFHLGERRLSGEEYACHPLRVAITAAEMNLDTNSILTSLIHNTMEGKREEVLQKVVDEFGEDVKYLLLILEEINKGTASEETDKRTVTRYILGNAKDIRPILIKLCDVLDDMRTIDYLPNDLIKIKATKIFDIYGPLAEYLNLGDIKKEIEEIAFMKIKPEDYDVISQKIVSENINNELFSRYIRILEETSEIVGYIPQIFGRIKSKYSIYNKLKKYESEGLGTGLSNIKDMIAFSVILQTEEDCYLYKMALEDVGIIKDEYTDNYIQDPKPNGYRAIQLTLSLPQIREMDIEIHILTQEMYYANTYGPASHIAYKASKARYSKATEQFKWVEDIHNQIKEAQKSSKQERSIPITANIFENNIYVFTPKGRIIEMQKDSTALDFAYRVHTKIGHNAVRAKIDGIPKDLSEKIKTGQVIEILTSSHDKYPNADWLNIATSYSAKEKIRKALKMKLLAR